MDNDHDLLIELRTMVKLWHDEAGRSLSEHQKDDTRALAELDMKVSSAHRRMDDIKKEAASNHEALSTQIRGLITIKDKVLGGATVVMFIITTGLSIFTVLRHGS